MCRAGKVRPINKSLYNPGESGHSYGEFYFRQGEEMLRRNARERERASLWLQKFSRVTLYITLSLTVNRNGRLLWAYQKLVWQRDWEILYVAIFFFFWFCYKMYCAILFSRERGGGLGYRVLFDSMERKIRFVAEFFARRIGLVMTVLDACLHFFFILIWCVICCFCDFLSFFHSGVHFFFLIDNVPADDCWNMRIR